MAKLTSKIEASTLVEVLISMVIIMAVFVAGIAIYTKVTQSGFSFSKAEAQQHMHKIMQESIASNDWTSQELLEDSIVYTKSIKEYAGYPDVILLEVEAIQNGNSLGKLRQLVKKGGLTPTLSQGEGGKVP